MFLAALLLLPIAPGCTVSTDDSLSGNLAGWRKSATSFGSGGVVTVPAGDVAKLSGVPAGAKPGRGAMLSFRIAKAGRYGVALDQRGWIDVVPGAAGGKALESAAHGHGPICSTIAKIVRFDLKPGSYRLYLTGLQTPTARTMLVAPD